VLDEESVQTYKSIRLTRDLRADILARQRERHAPFTGQSFLRPAAALCSLLLLAAVLFFALPRSKPGVYTGDGMVENQARAAITQSVPYTGGLMRASLGISPEDTPQKIAAHCVALRLSYGQDVTVAISGGALLLPLDDGSFVYAGAFGAVRDGTSLYWSLEACETDAPLSAEILSETGDVIDTVTLTYDAADGIWLIANTMSDK